MERMVTDEIVGKVLAICDAQYAQKADARRGGVGTESQIISKEIYEKVKQTKFIPIVSEYDSEGKPYLPAFFASRIYIDMSSREKTNENYPKLVRCIFDQPLYEKPPVGSRPSYVADEGLVPSTTGGKLAMVKDAILKGKMQLVEGFTKDYLDNFLASLEDLNIDPPTNQETIDEKVISSIHGFLPRRDEFIEFLDFFTKFNNDDTLYNDIREMYEKFLKFLKRPPVRTVWWPTQADSFRFIGYELFLYLATVLIKNRRYTELDIFVDRPYFYFPDSGRADQTGALAGYPIFCPPCSSLDQERNNRLGLRRLSVTAELIKERAYHKNLNFDLLMQADLILFLRSMLHPRHGEKYWTPRTLVFAEYSRAFEIFAKAASRSYFAQLATLLRIKSKDELVKTYEAAEARGEPMLSRFPLEVELRTLMNLESLGTQP